MDGDKFNPINYAILGRRLRVLQQPWKPRIRAAKARGDRKREDGLRKRSPCGRLASIVRQVSEPDDGGNLLSVGLVLREWNKAYKFNYGGVDHPDFNDIDQISKTTKSIIIEAQRGNGRSHQEALIRYLWERKLWRPEPNDWPLLLKVIGSAAQPFFETAQTKPKKATVPSEYDPPLSVQHATDQSDTAATGSDVTSSRPGVRKSDHVDDLPELSLSEELRRFKMEFQACTIENAFDALSDGEGIITLLLGYEHFERLVRALAMCLMEQAGSRLSVQSGDLAAARAQEEKGQALLAIIKRRVASIPNSAA